MTRGVQSATAFSLAADAIHQAHLVEVQFDAPTGTLYLTDAFRDLVYNGITYLRGGNLLQIGDIEEHASLLVPEMTIAFSGVDQAMTSLLLQENYLDRTLIVRRAYLNGTTGLISSVEPYFEGRMNLPVISEDPDQGTSTISVSVTSIWVDFERSPGRLTNHETQQLWFPGDRGFEFAGQIFDALPWGRS
jgi:hypothetical protein